MVKTQVTVGTVALSAFALLAAVLSGGTARAGGHHHRKTYELVAVQPTAVTAAPAAVMMVSAAPAYSVVSAAPAAFTFAPAPTTIAAAPTMYYQVTTQSAPAPAAPAPAAAPAAPAPMYQWKLMPVAAPAAASPQVGFAPPTLLTITQDTRDKILKTMKDRVVANKPTATTQDELVEIGTSIVQVDVNKNGTQALTDAQKADINTLATSVLAESPTTPQTPTTPAVNPGTQQTQQVQMMTLAPAPFQLFLQPVQKHHFLHHNR